MKVDENNYREIVDYFKNINMENHFLDPDYDPMKEWEMKRNLEDFYFSNGTPTSRKDHYFILLRNALEVLLIPCGGWELYRFLLTFENSIFGSLAPFIGFASVIFVLWAKVNYSELVLNNRKEAMKKYSHFYPAELPSSIKREIEAAIAEYDDSKI